MNHATPPGSPPTRQQPARPFQDRGNLTIYGRKPVLEALQDPAVTLLRLHLARSNQSSELIRDLERAAARAGAPVSYHSKLELSRISRNGRQDQGVAADLRCAGLKPVAALPATGRQRLIAIDRINNPQNLGMAMRSIAASPLDGLLLARERGTTGLSPLVIKASAGAFFRTPVYQCDALAPTLQDLQRSGHRIIALEAGAGESLFALPLPPRCVFVLGNESEGISEAVAAVADSRAAIPLQRGVESLNVAVAAAIVAFLPGLLGPS